MNALQNPHPAGARLDAVATGDADPAAIAHVASCVECKAYVERLKIEIEASTRAPRVQPGAFVGAVVRRRSDAQRSRRARGRWLGVTSSGIALAAGILLMVRALPNGPALPETPVAPTEGPIRFKGGSQIAIVVDRNGAQSRETGSLKIAPGDRIRVEVALDHDDDVQAGVLSEGGEWVELQPSARLTAGTHFSEKSVAFDEHVDDGWIVVGPPAAVSLARGAHDFSGVHAIRIHPLAR